MRDLVTSLSIIVRSTPINTKLLDPEDFAQTNGAKSPFKSQSQCSEHKKNRGEPGFSDASAR